MISPSLLGYRMEGLSKFITILHGGGVFPIYYNITMGGGSLGTPNLYYVIYGRPLIAFSSLSIIYFLCERRGFPTCKSHKCKRPGEVGLLKHVVGRQGGRHT